MDVGLRGAGTGGRRELFQPLDHQPHFGGGSRRRSGAEQPFAGEQRAVRQLDDGDRQDAVQRELALQKPDAGDQAEPDRTAARHPEQQDVQERLEVAAAGLEQLRRRAGRRHHEEQRRGEPQRRPESRLAMEQPHEQQPDRQIDQQQRELQRSDRRSRDEKDRCRQPGLHGENVILTIQEQRERDAFGQVLRHEAHDRLIGVEVGLRPEDEDGRTGDDQDDDERGDERALAIPDGGLAGV